MKGWCELSPIHSAPTSNSNLVPLVMEMGESQFSGAQTPGASFQPKPSQPMTSFMPVSSTEEEKKKAAAAAMAAKLAASTSSAQMLTSVLSSIVAEEAASTSGGRSIHPPDFGLNTPIYPMEKRAKLEKPPSDINSSGTGSKNSYFACLQQSLPMSQPSQGETQFSQPPPNNHFTQSSGVMMPYGYNTNTSVQPPPLPPNIVMGLARPLTNRQQQSPASGGYYRPPGIGFYGQSHPPATPPMPRQ